MSDIAAGNPKHIQELVDQLLCKAAISVDNGVVKVHVDSFEHVSFNLPFSLSSFSLSFLRFYFAFVMHGELVLSLQIH